MKKTLLVFVAVLTASISSAQADMITDALSDNLRDLSGAARDKANVLDAEGRHAEAARERAAANQIRRQADATDRMNRQIDEAGAQMLRMLNDLQDEDDESNEEDDD